MKADAQPNGDGSSWSNAFGTLQEALDATADADPAQGRTYEIWIAAGTYYPTMGFGGPYARAFQMRNGVTIYGGFPADADDTTGLSDRDWEQHKTILRSFDPADPDNPNGFPLFYHPQGLGLNETAVLDGVTLTGVDHAGEGGAVYNDTASPTLRNVTIKDNKALIGGGMFNTNSSPFLENVIIAQNSANGDGGGMFNVNSNPILKNVTITENSAASDGGGMVNRGGKPFLDNVTISKNEARYLGGGMFNYGSQPTLSGVVLVGNKGYAGAGMFNHESSPAINHTIISGNVASGSGGGLFNREGSHPKLSNVLISGNKAQKGAGMLNDRFMISSHPVLTNVTIVGNLVTNNDGQSGGGIFNLESNPVIQNSIIVGNGSGNEDGQTDNIFPKPDTTPPGSIIDGSYQDAKNVFIDPVEITMAPTDLGNYRLRPDNNPLRDIGWNDFVTSDTDLDGNVRIRFHAVDPGAYEIQGSPDATLTALAVDDAPVEAFQPTTFAYKLSVPMNKSSVTVTATAAHGHATIRLGIQGTFVPLPSGASSAPVALDPGMNTIVVKVTAEDDITVKEYVLEIQRVRATPSPPVTRPDPPGDPTPPTFSDIASHWAEDHIMTAAASNLVSGYPDGTFRPDAPITRAEFVVMLVNALKLDGAGAAVSFADWDKVGAWAQPAIQLAVQAGMVRGYEDGTFRPDAHITRTEMAVMIARALRLGGAQATATGFADDTQIPSWAKAAVAALRELGTVTGRDGNNFAPHDLATRAEAVVMLLRMLESRPAQ